MSLFGSLGSLALIIDSACGLRENESDQVHNEDQRSINQEIKSPMGIPGSRDIADFFGPTSGEIRQRIFRSAQLLPACLLPGCCMQSQHESSAVLSIIMDSSIAHHPISCGIILRLPVKKILTNHLHFQGIHYVLGPEVFVFSGSGARAVLVV